MDGSNPVVLLKSDDQLEAVTIDLETKKLYFSVQYPKPQVCEFCILYLNK